jgi:carbonic anhydrase
MRSVALQFFILAAAASVFVAVATASDAEFSYSGDDGPGFWSAMNPAWSACGSAAAEARQSPIDIVGAAEDPKLKPLDLKTFPTTVDIINNGHTIEQHYEGTGTAINFAGKKYELLQFHFHSLAEHVVNGERGDMELHAVFQAPQSSDKLVVGVIFEVGKTENRFLKTLIDAGLPKKHGAKTVVSTPINVADVLTSPNSYFTYPGSLTTPPCSETVTWVVLAKRARLTQAQLQAFRDILGNDFRPLQARNGRAIRSAHAKALHD